MRTRASPAERRDLKAIGAERSRHCHRVFPAQASTIVVERLGHEAVALAKRRGIERRRLAVGGIADRVERLAVREGRGEAQRPGAENIFRQAFDEGDRLRPSRRSASCRRPNCRASRNISSESVVPLRALKSSSSSMVSIGRRRRSKPEIWPLCMKDQVAMRERMAVVAPRAAAGGGPHMGEEERRADLPRQALQIAVGPGRQDVAVAARLRPVAIPGDAEAVAIGRRSWRGWRNGIARSGNGRARTPAPPDRGGLRDRLPSDTCSFAPAPASLRRENAETRRRLSDAMVNKNLTRFPDLQGEDDKFLTPRAITFRNAACCFVNSGSPAPFRGLAGRL